MIREIRLLIASLLLMLLLKVLPKDCPYKIELLKSFEDMTKKLV